MTRWTTLIVVLAATAACSKSSSAPKDAPGTDASLFDAPTDAPPLPPCTPVAGSNIHARLIGKADDAAMLATSPPGDLRLFVVERSGALRIFDHEVKVATPFLDLGPDGSNIVVSGGEQGLLGLAFHPNYASNHQFFVYYTANNPNRGADPHNPYVDIVERFTTSADPNVADPGSGTIILSVPDYASNHNGGMLEFGGDGFLYISLGDGGGMGDPDRNGQNTSALLAKILRIDVDHPANSKPYGIPADNPFATSGGAPEVWIYGVRNPWRWSFDRANGDMYIGDVGQGQIEEIDVLKAGAQAGRNLGWSAYEGSLCCATSSDNCTQDPPYQACTTAGKTFAQTERDHADGWYAIIGGQVYRGTCYPDIVGSYFYTDNVKHGLAKAQLQGDGSLTTVDLAPPTGGWPASPSSIHADARGELFETTTSGNIYAIEAGP